MRNTKTKPLHFTFNQKFLFESRTSDHKLNFFSLLQVFFFPFFLCKYKSIWFMNIQRFKYVCKPISVWFQSHISLLLYVFRIQWKNQAAYIYASKHSHRYFDFLTNDFDSFFHFFFRVIITIVPWYRIVSVVITTQLQKLAIALHLRIGTIGHIKGQQKFELRNVSIKFSIQFVFKMHTIDDDDKHYSYIHRI